MMKIPIARVPEDGSELVVDEDITLHEVTDGSPTVAHVSCTIVRVMDDYLVRGDVSATVGLECARCLATFSQRVEGHLDFICSEGEKLPDGEDERGMLDDESDTCMVHDGMIDVGEVAREMLLLGMPIKPLCSDECKGICPECGQDLNEGECACAPRAADPRFDALRALLTEKAKKKE
jgi:uncharacterized protein